MRLLFVLFIIAVTSTANAKVMSLQQYIGFIEKQDIEVQKFIKQQMQLKFNKNLNLPDHSWVLALSTEYGIDSRNDNDTEASDLSLTKNFLSTGTELEASYRETQLADRNETVQTVLVRQNILKNAFGSQTRKLDELLGDENKVLKLEIIESYEAYLQQRISAYLDFKLAYENQKTMEALLKDARGLYSEIRQKRRSGIANTADYERMTSQVLSYERQLMEAQLQVKQAKQNLVQTFDYNESSLDELQPQEEFPFIEEPVVFDKEKQRFLASGRSQNIRKLKNEVSEKRLSVSKHELWPEAQIVVGYNNEEANRFSTTVDREELIAGLQFTYAFDNPFARAQYDQAKYNKELRALEYQSEERALKVSLLNMQDSISTKKAAVALLEKQVTSSSNLVREVGRRFRRGVVDLESLVDAQNSYQQSLYNLAEEKVALAKLKIEWKDLTDTLVTKTEI